MSSMASSMGQLGGTQIGGTFRKSVMAQTAESLGSSVLALANLPRRFNAADKMPDEISMLFMAETR